MGEETKYLHRIEQIGAELRSCANSMEGLEHNVRMYQHNPAHKPKLKAVYEEYMRHHPTHSVIEDLHELVRELKQKGDQVDREVLNADLTAANEHAVRLCHAMLNITKLLIGE